MKKSLLPLLFILLFATLACSVFSTDQAPTADSNILFQDDFSNKNSGWDQATWDQGLTDYGNDVYRIAVNIPSYDVWANPGKNFDGDVRIEVDATKVGGEDDNDYGIICRYSGTPESPNYYFSIISSDGFAAIGKTTGGTSEYLSSEQMEPADAIKQGAVTNHIRTDCIGSSITLYVNGQQVATATDSSYTGGDVGLMAGTFEISSTEINFDNFLVLKP